MLNEDQEMSGDSPIVACAGGDGLVEVIKLDRLGRRGGRRGEESMEVAQEDQRVSVSAGVGLSLLCLRSHADMTSVLHACSRFVGRLLYHQGGTNERPCQPISPSLMTDDILPSYHEH